LLEETNFTSDVSLDEEELVKFWMLSASGLGSENFLKDSLTLQDTAFSTVWLISLEELIGSA